MKKLLFIFIVLLLVTPLVCANGTEEVVCYAEDDACIRSLFPDTPLGGYPWVISGSDTNETNRSLFKYDLSSVPGDATIISVVWHFWVEQVISEQGFVWGAYQLENYWEEEEVTWDNCPDFGDEIIFEHGCPLSAGWCEIGFTEYGVEILQGWISGSWPHCGFIWKRDYDETYILARITATSKEGDDSYQTYLSVTYAQSQVQTTSIGKVRALFR